MIRLLVVDDDVPYARLVAASLEDVARVDEAQTLGAATTADLSDLDVVLCDLNLPDAQGPEVVRALAAAYPAVTLVATSGVDGGAGDAALQAGAHAFILKGGELDGRLRDAVLAAARRTAVVAASAARRIAAGPVEAPVAGLTPRDLGTSAPVAMLVLDTSGGCTWTNPRFDELAGLSHDDALGTGWQERLHPADRREVLETWHHDTARARPFEIETRLRHPDGRIRQVRLAAAPLPGARGDWAVVALDETERLAALRELADRRAQLESVMGASPSPIFLKDPDDHIVLANGATEALLGRPREDLIGTSASLFIDPEIAESVRALDRDVLDSGEPRVDEIAGRGHDGAPHTWLVNRFPVRDADGVLTGVGVIASDITERRRLERELERQRELLEQAQAIAHLATWEWDPSGVGMAASRQLAQILGVPEDQPLTMRHAFEQSIHPDDRPGVVAAFERSLTVDDAQDLTFRATDGDGRLRYLRTRWRSRLVDGRRVLVGSTQDVTHEHLREAARRAAEAQLRLVFDHAPIGLGLADLDGHWIRVNPAVCQILGRRPAELLGTSVDEIIHPEDRDADAGRLEQLIAGDLDSYEIEKRCLRPDGSLLWVVFAVSAVRDQGGRPTELVLQLLDMTVRRDLEARLAELADLDAATDRPNPGRLRAELERAITWRRRSGEPATLLLVALEGADPRALGEVLRGGVRRTDVVVRADDHRFALLLPDTTGAAAMTVMDKLRAATGAAALHGTLAFGAVEIASGTQTPDEVLDRAGAALDVALTQTRPRP